MKMKAKIISLVGAAALTATLSTIGSVGSATATTAAKCPGDVVAGTCANPNKAPDVLTGTPKVGTPDGTCPAIITGKATCASPTAPPAILTPVVPG